MAVGRLHHAAAEQNIVDGNQAAGAHQLQAIFIILRCGRFVGIDKGDVVAERFALLEQLGQGEQRRLQIKADFVRHAGIGPALAGDVGEAYVDVAGADAAVFGQR